MTTLEQQQNAQRRLPMLNKAAFMIETLAHLRGMERELLPQAQYLRDLQANLSRLFNSHNDMEVNDCLNVLKKQHEEAKS